MLTTIVFLPLAGALLLLLVDNRDGRRDALIRWAALVASLLVFGATLLLWSRFDPSRPDFQFIERHAWIPAFGIQYLVGVDGYVLRNAGDEIDRDRLVAIVHDIERDMERPVSSRNVSNRVSANCSPELGTLGFGCGGCGADTADDHSHQH